jgi:ABC-type antimicrobial peptide transport system permease subunit
VNEAFAQRFLPHIMPVGATFGVKQDSGKPDKLFRVIGVVGNTKYTDVREDFGPIVFLSASQDPAPDLESIILIRSFDNVTALTSEIKQVAAKTSPSIVVDFSVLRTSIRDGLLRERLLATLSGFYGLLAALLAIIGIYGIVSYGVARRTSEIGIRMALGAGRARILGMIVSNALKLIAIGVPVGTLLVLVTGRAMQTLLFGTTASDPVSLAIAIAAMTLVAVAASLLPARRAASLDPMKTLRHE